MSRTLNVVLGLSTTVFALAAMHYKKELEKNEPCACKQPGAMAQTGQTSYGKMRLFYQPPMVKAWSPSYTGAMTDAALYAEAEKIYQQRKAGSEPPDAWETASSSSEANRGEIETPVSPRFIPGGGMVSADQEPVRYMPIGLTPETVRRMQEEAGVFAPQAESMPRRERMPHGRGFEAVESIGFDSPMAQNGSPFGFEAEAQRNADYMRKKREFESNYEGTYEEYLAALAMAKKAGGYVTPSPKRRSYTTTAQRSAHLNGYF